MDSQVFAQKDNKPYRQYAGFCIESKLCEVVSRFPCLVWLGRQTGMPTGQPLSRCNTSQAQFS